MQIIKISLASCFIAFFLILVSNCSKTPPQPHHPYGFLDGKPLGVITVYLDSSKVNLPVDLTVNGNSNLHIDGYFTSPPICDYDNYGTWTFNFIDTAGTYAYEAIDQKGYTWKGTFILTADACHYLKIGY